MEILRDLLLALVGPAGIWIGWWLQRRDKVEERTEKRSDLLRNKAEELYQELEAVSGEVAKTATKAIQLLKPTEEGDPPVEPIALSVGRLRGLAAVYFPDAMALFQEYDQEIEGWVAELRKGLQSGPDNALPEPSTIRQVTYVYAASTQASTHSLVRRVRSFMDEKSKTLV